MFLPVCADTDTLEGPQTHTRTHTHTHTHTDEYIVFVIFIEFGVLEFRPVVLYCWEAKQVQNVWVLSYQGKLELYDTMYERYTCMKAIKLG